MAFWMRRWNSYDIGIGKGFVITNRMMQVVQYEAITVRMIFRGAF